MRLGGIRWSETSKLWLKKGQEFWNELWSFALSSGQQELQLLLTSLNRKSGDAMYLPVEHFDQRVNSLLHSQHKSLVWWLENYHSDQRCLLSLEQCFAGKDILLKKNTTHKKRIYIHMYITHIDIKLNCSFSKLLQTCTIITFVCAPFYNLR